MWLDEGNTGTEQEFLDSLKGTDGTPGDPGTDGDSAYQVWLDEGNTGTEQEFLDSLKGEQGPPGTNTNSKLTQIPYLNSNEISNLTAELGSIAYNYETSTLGIYVRSVNHYTFSYPLFNTNEAEGQLFVANGLSINAHMTFKVDAPVAIRNIRLLDAMDGNKKHSTDTFPVIVLDDDYDLENGHLGGAESKVLENGKYIHIILDGINPSNYNHRFWYYNSPPSSFGRMSDFLTFVSFENRPFDFSYEIATTSTEWKTIINYN